MKIRNGFVSNSSSSSFILPINGDKDRIIVKVTLDDLIVMSSNSFNSRYNIISTEDDLKAYFMESYAWGKQTFDELMKEEDHLVKSYDKHMALMKDGGSIMVGSIDNSEYNVLSLIEKAGGIVEY